VIFGAVQARRVTGPASRDPFCRIARLRKAFKRRRHPAMGGIAPQPSAASRFLLQRKNCDGWPRAWQGYPLMLGF
jgi:hypothetical protein